MSDCHDSWTRRQMVSGGGILLGAATVFGTSNASAAEGAKIVQPAKPSAEAFVKRAFEMRDLAIANGDQGYGALIVNSTSSQIVSQMPSRVVTHNDPSAHAEMEAIREAARRLGKRDLSGHTMYSSSRPCPMCEAAAYWANLELMYYGRDAARAGAPKLCGSI